MVQAGFYSHVAECSTIARRVPGSILGLDMEIFLRVRDKLGARPGSVNVKGQPCGTAAQWAECSHGKREALGLSPGLATIFTSPWTFGGSVWVRG